MKIHLPNNWSPRDYQLNTWKALGKCNVEGGLRKFLSIWHRRAGKDDVYLHHNACSAFERVGNYWYMLPEYNQCRKAIWDAVNPHSGKRRIDEAFPPEIRSNTLDKEMKIAMKNGSTFQLMGSDNYDSLVGSPPIGITYSEYPISNPASWSYLRPIMLENGGWAAFNGTPRGKNHAYKQMEMARDSDEWFYEMLTVDDTGVFTPAQLQNELQELIAEHGEEYGTSIWRQEYWCSFDAALLGSIWGDAVSKVTNDGRVGHVPHIVGYPVHTAWDLGKDDDTAIWFYQVMGGDLKVIDFHAKNNKDVDYYAQYLRDHGKDRGFEYGTHWLPHDARPDRMGMGGKTILQQFIDYQKQIFQEDDYDIGDFAIVPSFSKQDGIQAARKTFQVASFDKDHCEDGLEALKMYRRKYDEDNKKYSDEPVHDWASHASDSWRYLSLTWVRSKENQVVRSVHQGLIENNITKLSFGAMKDAHFRNKKRERNKLFA